MAAIIDYYIKFEVNLSSVSKKKTTLKNFITTVIVNERATAITVAAPKDEKKAKRSCTKYAPADSAVIPQFLKSFSFINRSSASSI